MEKSLKKRDIIRYEATNDHLDSSIVKVASGNSQQQDATTNVPHKINDDVTAAGDTKGAWACPACGEAFHGAFSLDEHIVRGHLFDCDTCSDVFHDRILLERHLADEHGVCDPAFSWRLIRFWTEHRESLRIANRALTGLDERQTIASKRRDSGQSRSDPLKTHDSHHKRKCKTPKASRNVETRSLEGKRTGKPTLGQRAAPAKSPKVETAADTPQDRGKSVLPRSKGIDSDPFMRCFLREVDTNQGSVDGDVDDTARLTHEPGVRDSEVASCLNNGNLLYLYPLVEYRPAYADETHPKTHGYLEELQVPKVEVFYHQPDGGETSSACESSDGEPFPAPKVFMYSSPSSEDWVKREPAEESEDEETEEELDRCILCKCAFPDKARLQEHMVSTHIDECANACGVCGRRFDTIFKARSHVMMEHVDVQCRCCQRQFTRSTALRRHMVTHCGPRDRPPSAYKRCEVCLESFLTSTGLADHVETEHASLLEHRCDLCDRTFLTEDELFVHVDRDPHVCLLCSTRFESTLRLREHLLGHATDRQVVELFTPGSCGNVGAYFA